MATDTKNSKELFEADRRVLPRADNHDRRIFLRPSTRLRILGVLVSALVAAIIYAGASYYFN